MVRRDPRNKKMDNVPRDPRYKQNMDKVPKDPRYKQNITKVSRDPRYQYICSMGR